MGLFSSSKSDDITVIHLAAVSDDVCTNPVLGVGLQVLHGREPVHVIDHVTRSSVGRSGVRILEAPARTDKHDVPWNVETDFTSRCSGGGSNIRDGARDYVRRCDKRDVFTIFNRSVGLFCEGSYIVTLIRLKVVDGLENGTLLMWNDVILHGGRLAFGRVGIAEASPDHIFGV